MVKKKRSEMSFSQILEDTLAKHRKKQAKSMVAYGAALQRSGKKAGEPIDIMDLLKK